MIGFLLDTNVLSELRKPRCNASVLAFSEASSDRCYTSDICFAEIRFGIDRAPDANLRTELTRWLNEDLRRWFVDRVVETNEDVVHRWRHIRQQLSVTRSTPSEPDTLIAAAAAIRGLVVVTRDWRPFVLASVPVLDPWRGLFHSGKVRRADVNVAESDLLRILRTLSTG